jgi:hypothetical protein
LVDQLLRLPDHAPYFSIRLKSCEHLFKNSDFGSTDQRGGVEEYQNANSRDLITLMGTDTPDMLSSLFVNTLDSMEKHIINRAHTRFSQSSQQSQQDAEERGIEFATLNATLDALTCVLVPLLFTATLFALALIRRLMVRIAVVGAFSLAFTMSAKLIYGRMSRGEVFAFTAAFFAVASVFISMTESNLSKLS